jgi:hypothetical protein
MRRSIRAARKIAPTYVAFNVVVPYTEAGNAQVFDPSAERAVFFPARWAGHSEKDLDAMLRRGMVSFYARPRTLMTLLRNPRAFLRKVGLFFAAIRAGRSRPPSDRGPGEVDGKNRSL